MGRAWALAMAALASTSCRCSEAPVQDVTLQVSATPTSIVFPDTLLGQEASARLTLVNTGRLPASLTLSVSAPFALEAPRFEVPAGARADVTVLFRPSTTGPHVAALRVLGAEVGPLSLLGIGVSAPTCPAPGGCRTSSFDPTQGRCKEDLVPDGTPCEDTCLEDAACRAGECTGTPRSCDDGVDCTVDFCQAATGCRTLPSNARCAPSSPCEVGVCDSLTGCRTSPLPDGAFCGPPDCRASLHCLQGACVPSPAGGACDGGSPPLSFTALVSSHDSDDLILFHSDGNTLTWEYPDGPGMGLASWPHQALQAPDGGLLFANRRRHTLVHVGASAAGFPQLESSTSPLLDTPVGLTAAPDGGLYVASHWTHAVVRYDPGTRAVLDAFVPPREGGLVQPYGLVLGPDGALYVSSMGTGEVLRFDGQTGQLIGVFAHASPVVGLTGLTFHENSLFVGSWEHGVFRFDAQTGASQGVFIPPGTGGLESAHSLTFGPDGRLWICDFTAGRILRFDAVSGAFVDEWLGPGHPSGLAGPTWMLFLE